MQYKNNFSSHNEKETFNFGVSLGKDLSPGDVLCLYGDLGAGKTILAKGIAKGLKIKNNVNSPTFVIFKIYPIKQRGFRYLCHIDAYRLKNEADLANLGLEDFFADSRNIILLEWPQNIKKFLKPYQTRITDIFLKNIKTDPCKRKILIKTNKKS